MKLLLVQPPIRDFYETDIRLQPIGLAYLKAAVHKWLPEVEVKIIDFHRGWGRHTVALPEDLNYLKPFYAHRDTGPFSTFHQYYHFGADAEEIAHMAEKEKPDIVGISCLFSPYYREALETASAIKKATGSLVIIGGSHVSAEPISVLEHRDVDFVVRGEGERPLVEFLRRMIDLKAEALNFESADWSDIPSLGHKRNDRLFLNEIGGTFDIAELPFPDLSDLPKENYLYDGRPMTFVITSRGCPHACSFCSVHATFGKAHRRRAVESILAELVLRYDQGYRVFDFEDDNLTFAKDDMKELCRKIAVQFPKRDHQLVAMNGISYLDLDSELLALMREAGFSHLNIALVSKNPAVCKALRRPQVIEKYQETVREAARLGFKITSYQILGLPSESLDSMIETLCFSARFPLLLGSSIFYLTPNSPIALELNHRASPIDMFRARHTAMAIETNHCKRDDIYTLFVTTRIINFFKAWPVPLGQTLTIDGILNGADKNNGASERVQAGLDIFGELLRTGILNARTSQGLRPLARFNSKLFFNVWRRLESIGTQDGGIIIVPYRTPDNFNV